jgi:hypothetical protein
MSTRKKLEVSTVTACAYWASALVNGDESGMGDDAEDRAAYEAFCAGLEKDGWFVVDIDRDIETGEAMEPWFTWQGLLYGCSVAGCEVIDYVIHRRVEA